MDHSIQTPPYAILIFTQNEIKAILEFALATFLRHFSLYEFAFKPRVDLILRSDPIINEKFNSRLESLDEMEIVDKTEVDRLKAFLGLGEFQVQTFEKQASEGKSHCDAESIGRHSSLGGSQRDEPGHATITNAMDLREEALATNDDVDWRKVGKVYNKNT